MISKGKKGINFNPSEICFYFFESNKIIREPRLVSSEDGHQQRNAQELFDVLLIEHDVARLDDVPGGSLRSSVDKIIVHPLYNNVTFDFDVALIRLENPIQFSSQPDFYRYDTFDFHSVGNNLF